MRQQKKKRVGFITGPMIWRWFTQKYVVLFPWWTERLRFQLDNCSRMPANAQLQGDRRKMRNVKCKFCHFNSWKCDCLNLARVPRLGHFGCWPEMNFDSANYCHLGHYHTNRSSTILLNPLDFCIWVDAQAALCKIIKSNWCRSGRGIMRIPWDRMKHWCASVLKRLGQIGISASTTQLKEHIRDTNKYLLTSPRISWKKWDQSTPVLKWASQKSAFAVHFHGLTLSSVFRIFG